MNKEALDRRVNLIIHPVRLQIVTELSRTPLTPRQLGELLPRIPQSTLYRHIGMLAEGGVLEVVAENQVNGVTERTYALVAGQARFSPEELSSLTSEEHLHYFTIFATALIDSFAEYIHDANLENVVADGLSYRRTVIYLSDDERAEFEEGLNKVLGRFMGQDAAPHRKRYTLAAVTIPTATPDTEAEDKERNER
jgi:DNA-binding transcriptional ArsR family regulator